MQKHVIFLNGPPRCGKDTAANCLAAADNRVRTYKFAAPLKSAIASLLGITEEELERTKDAPIGATLRTRRELLIGLSEDVVKPLMGHAWFGVRAGEQIQQERPAIAVISDAGFFEEVLACVRMLGNDYVPHLWRIHRPNCTFVGDSRSYVYECGFSGVELFNTGSESEFREAVVSLYAQLNSHA